MSTTQDYQKRIANKLVALQRKLERYTDLGLVDEKKALENVMCRLLNLIYGYKLTNLNHIQTNYPAIDLGDTGNRIAFQVTSTNSREKVRDTIQKFEKHELFAQYERLIILVTGERKVFSKDFSCHGITFSAEKDVWDFHTLTRDIEKLSFEKLRAIYSLLEREYPETNTKLLRMAAAFCWVFLALLVGILWRVETANKEVVPYIPPDATMPQKVHTHSYETNMDWWSMEQVASILSNQSRIMVYTGDDTRRFDKGAALTTLYSNLSDQSRYITRFSVYAENIVEDLSPKLFCDLLVEDNVLTCEIYNGGWGETGNIKIECIQVEMIEELGTCPSHTPLQNGAITSWEYPTIEPGETSTIQLFSISDFQMAHNMESLYGIAVYAITFRLYLEETGFEQLLDCKLYVDRYGIYDASVLPFIPGGNTERNYVVWIETSESEWQESYTIQQCLPANETVRLPIFIVPEKSCTMTVRIEFETMDGEIIEAVPLENVYFYVPYYNDPIRYVDGNLLNWDQIDGTEVIYFPFRNVETILP